MSDAGGRMRRLMAMVGGHGVRAVLKIAFLAPAVVAAQESKASPGAQSGGVLVPGWTGRVDAKAEREGARINDVRFWAMGDALHATGGPAVTYWNPAHQGRGAYTVEATFTQTKAPPVPEPYGLFFGGTTLDGDGENYLYCAIFGAGLFTIKHRFGGELHTLVDRRASGAIRPADVAGKATNAVAWKVTGDNVSCLVNGTAVATFPRAAVIGEGKLESTDGIYGIYVSRHLDLHIAGFRMTRP